MFEIIKDARELFLATFLAKEDALASYELVAKASATKPVSF